MARIAVAGAVAVSRVGSAQVGRFSEPREVDGTPLVNHIDATMPLTAPMLEGHGEDGAAVVIGHEQARRCS